MYEWKKMIQLVVDEIDECIRNHDDEALTLGELSKKLGYSEFYTTRKFGEISGMSLREYIQKRKLAFALKEVRDSEKSLLSVAVDYGFSSNEAFARAFKKVYGVTPSCFRKDPKPVVLRTKIHPFDRYFLGLGEIGMIKSQDNVKTYFVTIPEHKFLHIENRESNGYWDFWKKQAEIPGQNRETICGLLASIKGKLDDLGGDEDNCTAGQIMAYICDPAGRLCDWGFLRTECYGARLPADYSGPVPENMILSDIPEGEYVVFEHGPFDYEQENRTVEEKIETAMKNFDYASKNCELDFTPGRIMYLYYDPGKLFKYIRPIKRI